MSSPRVQSCALSATLTLLTVLVCNCFACREIANPYGDLKQNRFLQKTITIDVKNLNSKCEAYQEVLGMIAERDQLLFEKETANISLFDAKKASEDTRIQALSAEMEVDLARNALLSRQVQLKYLLDKTQAQEVKDELEKVSDKLKEMVLAATTLATSAQQYIAEVQDLRRLATKTSTRYTEYAADFSAACYRAIEAGKAGHWQGELQRHEATLFRYSVPRTGFAGSYYDAHKENFVADDRAKQLSGAHSPSP